jgi:hypothetical protein
MFIFQNIPREINKLIDEFVIYQIEIEKQKDKFKQVMREIRRNERNLGICMCDDCEKKGDIRIYKYKLIWYENVNKNTKKWRNWHRSNERFERKYGKRDFKIDLEKFERELESIKKDLEDQKKRIEESKKIIEYAKTLSHK